MERDTPITLAPAARNASVTKLPRPPFAPVISVTLPSSGFMFSSSLSRRPRHAELGIEGQPAAREYRLSGNVRCFIGCQEREHGSDFVGFSRTTHRNVALHFARCLRVVNPRFVDRRRHGARPHRVHPDAPGRLALEGGPPAGVSGSRSLVSLRAAARVRFTGKY